MELSSTKFDAKFPLRGLTVGGFATMGVVDVPAEAPLEEIAATMAAHGVHAVVVEMDTDWGIVSDSDLVSALASGESSHLLAKDIVGTEVVAVTCDDALDRATQLMAEHGLTHLIVTGGGTEPIGVISTFDLARALALRL